jgi:hypothetical protein
MKEVTKMRIIMSAIVLLMMAVPIGGCLVGVDDVRDGGYYGDRGYDRGRDHDRDGSHNRDGGRDRGDRDGYHDRDGSYDRNQQH